MLSSAMVYVQCHWEIPFFHGVKTSSLKHTNLWFNIILTFIFVEESSHISHRFLLEPPAKFAPHSVPMMQVGAFEKTSVDPNQFSWGQIDKCTLTLTRQ